MTVAVTNFTTGPYTGNGATTAFPFTFKALSEAEVSVYVDDVAISSDLYAVTLSTSGGTVTFDTAPIADAVITIVSEPSFTQDVALLNNGAFLPDTIEGAFDQAAVRDIALKGKVDIIFPSNGFSAEARAGGFLGYDAEGNAAILSGTGNDDDFRTDVAASSGAGLMGFIASQAGAQTRTVLAKLRDVVSVEEFGFRVANNRADNAAAILAALDAIKNGSYLTGLWIPPKAYACDHFYTSGDNIAILMEGATLYGPEARFTIQSGAAGWRIVGGHIVDTSNGDSNWLFDIGTCDDIEILGTHFQKNPIRGGYFGYIRAGSSRVKMDGFKFTGSNGISIQGEGHQFLNFDCDTKDDTGGDDLFAIKAHEGDAQTQGILIANGRARGYSDVVGIGSEIGNLAAADSTYSKWVRQVTIKGIEAKNCTSLVFIKPGAIGDYRDGTVDGVYMSDLSLEAREGERFRWGIDIEPARGSRVRNIRGRNININARADSLDVTTTAGAVNFLIPDLGAAASISDVDLQINFNDPYNGAVHSGAAPGYPVDHAVRAELANLAVGTMERIELDITANGTRQAVALIGAGLNNAIHFRRARFRNGSQVAVGGAVATNAGIYSGSHIRIDDAIITDQANGHPIGAAALTDTLYKSKVHEYRIGTIAAGTDTDEPCFIAPKACYIHRVEIVNQAAITQNDTDYTTLELHNPASPGDIVSRTTKVTGGVNITANARISLNAGTNNAVTAADGFNVPEGTVLRFQKTDSGAGKALTKALLLIYYTTHGR